MRNTVIHPVVLPVIAGLLWNLLGAPLPGTADEVLQLLGQAAVPLCLVIIGLSFAEHGLRALRSAGGAAIAISAAKLVLLPALVLALGVRGVRLRRHDARGGRDGRGIADRRQRVDLRAALRRDVPETTVAIVLSTLVFVAQRAAVAAAARRAESAGLRPAAEHCRAQRGIMVPADHSKEPAM